MENRPQLKEGDTVIVDEEFANGGYEALVLWAGEKIVRITDGEDIWDITRGRLRLKEENNG